ALQSARQVSRVLVDGPERAGDSWDAAADRIIRSRPGVEGALVRMWREALRTGADGLAADLVAASTAWQLDLADVTAHSHLFYGEDDTVVGMAHARWWACALPDAELRVVRHAGHLVPLVVWPEILSAVVR
ncbi:MAG TPA: hypothetical protein VG476_09730, partial [Acidimicrobiales bacterium]|nr:hypothetical protein [Acidimicrobiales bacterium]